MDQQRLYDLEVRNRHLEKLVQTLSVDLTARVEKLEAASRVGRELQESPPHVMNADELYGWVRTITERQGR